MACKAFHKGKYYVTFKRGFEDNKRDITVSVDKVFESDTLVSNYSKLIESGLRLPNYDQCF